MYLQIEPPAQPCVLFMIAVAVWVFVSLIVVSMFVVGVGTCAKSITYYYKKLVCTCDIAPIVM